MRVRLLFALAGSAAAACSGPASESPTDGGQDAGEALSECEDHCARFSQCFVESSKNFVDSLADGSKVTCRVNPVPEFVTCPVACESWTTSTASPDRAAAIACRDCLRSSLPNSCPEFPRAVCSEDCRGPARDFFESTSFIHVFGLECWPETLTEPPAACTDPRRWESIAITVENDPNGQDFAFDGQAEVVSAVPLRLALANSATISIQLPADVAVPLAVGDLVHARLERICPFGCYVNDVWLEAPDGTLRIAAWSRPTLRATFSPAHRRLEPSPCASIRMIPNQDCAHRLMKDLIVSIGGVEVRVSSGTSATQMGHTVHNFSSAAFFGVICSDATDGFTTGAITGPP